MGALRNEFIMCAQRTFLRTLEDRKPEVLEKVKPIPRDMIIEFFNACNTKMDLPETFQLLYNHIETEKKVPNQLIINIQRDMLEVLGFEADHGCNMLSRIGKDFPKDQDLHRQFEGWRMKAQGTCMEVVKKHQ